jgi:hypothetical protein
MLKLKNVYLLKVNIFNKNGVVSISKSLAKRLYGLGIEGNWQIFKH